ncbi:hypothetical protein J7T55_011196 [Diaporthe amygdali]|uniref:uncharacterized protein n=1 Tax=Phomopsis amygdali TaxID=1214568 RepID=UPI0022FEDFB3|nr:uncharacterized protein J7T55_011196 [Diaporthe amygdali]KAJ0108706.1 hypothetical protein J7T55_011196 [Diaporthe amygdali]
MATPEITMMNAATSRRMACKLTSSLLGFIKDEAEAYIDRLKASSRGTTDTSPSCLNFNSPANPVSQDALPPALHEFPMVPPEGVGDAVNKGNDSDLVYRQQSLETSGPDSRGPPQVITTQQAPARECDLPSFPMDDGMNIDPSDIGFYPQDGLGFQTEINENIGAAFLEPITRFSSAVFRSQAETSVMASVVAEYIAWLRKAPPGGGMPTARESPVYLGMLETLETRLQELCDMSKSRSVVALRELVAALEALAPAGGAMAVRLASLEDDVEKEARERAEVFRSRYNPCALLSQQSGNTS